MKKLLLIILALLMCLTACTAQKEQTANTGDASDNASDTVETIPEDALLFTDESGAAAYTVIYPDFPTEIIEAAAEDLRSNLTVVTGAKFAKSTDRDTKTKDKGEILIGLTNREQSKVTETLKEREYVIKVDGNKIVITGGSDYAIITALGEFQAMFSKDAPYVTETLSVSGKADKTQYLVAVTNRSSQQIDIYDLVPASNNTMVKVKSLPISTPAAGLNIRSHTTFGDVVVWCGSKHAEIMSYETGEKIWSTDNAADNAHGIELLPNDVVAVASSSGNEVRFFDIFASSSTYKSMKLEDAHGVLWDPENEVVWALGLSKLTAYKVERTGSGITVTEDTSKSVKLISDYGHDIAPVYGDTDKMWITTSGGLYIYSKSDKTFTTHINGDNNVIKRSNIKGIGNFDDGSILSLYPDGALYEWTTQTINLYFKYGDKLYHTTYMTLGTHYYKCRVLRTDYQ